MEYSYIPSFSEDEFSFEGAWCFEGKEFSLLLSHFGSSIVIHNELVKTLVQQVPTEDLAFKLHQRGFSTVYSRHRFQSVPMKILPTFFMIDFTTKCNCSCIYCLRHFENVGKDIDEQRLYDICTYIIDYCKKYQIKNIGFQPWGGEPLIDIDKIIWSRRLFQDAGINVNYSLQTNGLLLTPEMYTLLKQNNINFGISIDGDANSHDAHRIDVCGQKTHDKLIRQIKDIQFLDPNVELYSISVNSQYTLNHIEDNMAYLCKNLGIHHLKYNLVHPNGDDFDYNLLISESQIEEYIDKVIHSLLVLMEEGQECVEANIVSKALNIVCRPDDDLCHSQGCQGGYKFISFDQDGNIYPCEMIGYKELLLGNIYEGRDLIEMIAGKAKELIYFQNKCDEQCSNCPYQFFCRGGCKASSLAYGKKACDRDQVECTVNRTLYPRIIHLLLDNPKMISRMISSRIHMV